MRYASHLSSRVRRLIGIAEVLKVTSHPSSLRPNAANDDGRTDRGIWYTCGRSRVICSRQVVNATERVV